MNNYPQYAEIDGKQYKINTDFRVAIKCSKIAQDDNIGELERGFAIIYLLFGEDGLNDQEHYEKLLNVAKKYLACGKELDETSENPDMDFIEDYDYIETSFQSDYGIRLEQEHMHWWKFFNLMNGLSNSELGNCCILNRIRNLRNFDTSQIKDQKEKDKINKAKQQVALKPKREMHTQAQKDSVNALLEQLGIGKED